MDFKFEARNRPVTGKCPVPPKRDRRGQGAQLIMIFPSREAPACLPRPDGVAGELQLRDCEFRDSGIIKGLKIELTYIKISPRPSLSKRGAFPPFGKGGKEGFYKTMLLLL